MSNDKPRKKGVDFGYKKRNFIYPRDMKYET